MFNLTFYQQDTSSLGVTQLLALADIISLSFLPDNVDPFPEFELIGEALASSANMLFDFIFIFAHDRLDSPDCFHSIDIA